jgi:glycosyltransferase-like protein LARGE
MTRCLLNLIYVVDLVFTTDIAELWALFSRFRQSECIGAVAQQSDWYGCIRLYL